jgi:myo-inositol-1(or 4)-monophosphatase
MLPGCDVPTSTMRMGMLCYSSLLLADCRPPLFSHLTPDSSRIRMQPLLNIAVRAARRAGDIIVRNLDRVPSLPVRAKSRNDFVTEIDHMAERDIMETVRRTHPDHGFLGEESGRSGGDEFVWIIDPLDGTTNFLHGFPVFAVSIAVEHRGRLEHAVVYDPMRQELFTASRGDGAQVDGRRIRVSKQAELEGSLIGTGFPYRANTRWIEEYLAMLRVVMQQAAGIRRPGAASLDLAYVAAGRIDGFWEIGLSPWDTAAGTLLITEAGGRIGTLTGGDYTQGGNVIAGTPKVYEALVECVRPFVPEGLREA